MSIFADGIRPYLLIVLHAVLDMAIIFFMSQFWMNRTKNGIKERKPEVSFFAICWIFCSINLRSFPSIFGSERIPCFLSTIISYGDIFVAGTAYFFRAWMIYFSTAQAKALEEAASGDSSRLSWIRKNKKFVQLKFLVKLEVAGIVLSMLILAGLTRVPNCKFDRYARLVTLLFGVAVTGRLAQLLGKFKDAFGMLREMKMFCAALVICVVPFLIFTLGSGKGIAVLDWFEANVVSIDQWLAVAYVLATYFAIVEPVMALKGWGSTKRARVGPELTGKGAASGPLPFNVDEFGVEEMLENQLTREYMREYCKSALCAENVYFYTDLSQLRALEEQVTSQSAPHDEVTTLPPPPPGHGSGKLHDMELQPATADDDVEGMKSVAPTPSGHMCDSTEEFTQERGGDTAPAHAATAAATTAAPSSPAAAPQSGVAASAIVDPRVASLCEQLFDKFISEDGLFMVNINAPTRVALEKKFKAGERNSSIFDKTKKAVVSMLATDVLPRFKGSSAWDGMKQDLSTKPASLPPV